MTAFSLAATLADIVRRLAALERAPQLQRASIETDGASIDLAAAVGAAGAAPAIFYRDIADEPEGPFTEGTLWFVTDEDNRLQRWDGDSWEPFGFGDAAFSNISAGSVTTGTLDAQSVAIMAGTDFPRLEFAAGGLKAFDAAGVNTVTIGSDGKAYFTGTITGSVITGSTVRAAGVGDTSLTSTGHAFQAGPTAGANIAIDGNEIQARINGAEGALGINYEGGDVILGSYTKTNVNTLNNRTVINDKANRDTLYVNTDFTGGFNQTAVRVMISEEANPSAFNVLAANVAVNNASNRVFTLRGEGNGFADGAWNGGGADFAELFESTDGTELPLGRAVTLVNGKVRLAAPGDCLLGVTSATPTIVGNNPLNWPSMWQRDPYGRPLVDADGKRILNPAWDPELADTYEPRSERPEWAAIGLLGQVVVDDDGTGRPGGRLTVAAKGGTFTAGPDGYLVIARVDATHARVLVLP